MIEIHNSFQAVPQIRIVVFRDLKLRSSDVIFYTLIVDSSSVNAPSQSSLGSFFLAG